MRISRIYNNNVVLTVDHYGKESVMIGRGIAFGKRKGQLIDPSAVEQTFVPEQGMSGERLSMTLSEIGGDSVDCHAFGVEGARRGCTGAVELVYSSAG